MAAREVMMSIENRTGEKLELNEHLTQLKYGEWAPVKDGETWAESPPPVIEAGETGNAKAESNVFMGGTEGTVVYDSPAGRFSAEWSNPYSGSNTAESHAPTGYDAITQCGKGEHSYNQYTFKKR